MSKEKCVGECKCCTVFIFKHNQDGRVYKGRIRDFYSFLLKTGFIGISQDKIVELITGSCEVYMNWRFVDRA